MDPALIGAASGLASAAAAFAAFWMAIGGRISRAETNAENAIQVAAECDNELKETRASITALSAHFSLYRENAIEKFVTHQAITELEKRLVESQAKSEQRLVDALEGLNKRLDRLLEAGLRAAH